MLAVVVVGVVGGGLEPRLSPCATEELDAVDVVSFKLRVVSLGSLGFEEPAFEFIPVATALGNVVNLVVTLVATFLERGHMPCPELLLKNHRDNHTW